jgi:hypothetical protein
MTTPVVSVLMPTYNQSAFILRAIESLRAQTFSDWELVIVDDGSTDDTETTLAAVLDEPRIHYHRLERNQGVGAALNAATRLACGRYLAYLPSDDVYYPEHLARLTDLLASRPEVYLAYAGLRWHYERYSATLHGNEAVGREPEFLRQPPLPGNHPPHSGSLFALVQVMHRRDYERVCRWISRDEQETDALELHFWRGLLQCGATFAYAGDITCEWVDHPHQRHKIMTGRIGGLSLFRQHYSIPSDQPLNWQPSWGPCINEHTRFERYRTIRNLPAPDGLKILIAGELGFNPERIMAFEERGHKLYGLWYPHPESWDTTGPLAFGNIENIPYDHEWVERVRQIQPDLIYAMLNWQAIPFLYDVMRANPGIPFVFHFKEDPFICQEKGTWSKLVYLIKNSDAQIFINQEAFEWFQIALDGTLDASTTYILDGDLPKLDWFTDHWSPKLSHQDGQIHTVCAGRIIGISDWAAIRAAGIHIHFYGVQFQQGSPNFVREGLEAGLLHLHPTIEPRDWVRELSQYDAAWFHIFDSHNWGDLRRAHRDDLNLPARMGTYAAAGLPWILKDNRRSRVAIQSAAVAADVGVFFNNYADLAAQLSNRDRLTEMTDNMRSTRKNFAFDTYADELIALFRQTVERHIHEGNHA